MSIDDPRGITSDTTEGSPDGRFLGVLRAVARIAVLVGGMGSLALMLRAGRDTPRLLLVAFVFWVLSPFVALAWAIKASKRWSVLTRATLYWVTLVIALASLAFYGGVISPPAGSANAAVFVAVPPASWLFMVIAVSLAALVSRKR
jgi:hypothetical protein